MTSRKTSKITLDTPPPSRGDTPAHQSKGGVTMRTWLRFLGIVVTVVLVMALAPTAPAQAVDVDAMLADEALSEPGANDIVASFGEPSTTSAFEDCPERTQAPSHPDITYKVFEQPLVPPTPILLDEYDPLAPWGPQEFPILILVHGGGWWRGCRWALQQVAMEYAGWVPNPAFHPQKFIVLNIDYRLACDPSNPNLQDSPILPMCGWNYVRQDAIPGLPAARGAATHDVQDAVRWVTDTWVNLPDRPPWDGRTFLLGTSAGGTLAYFALAPSSTVGGSVASQVHAVASWSGHHEFDLMEGFDPVEDTFHWPCEEGQSNAYLDCQKSLNLYLGCSVNVYPDPACIGPSEEYTDGSVITWFTNNAVLPPAFFANAGGPYAGDGRDTDHQEVVALQSVIDFGNTLLLNQWVEDQDFRDCIADFPAVHGRGLRRFFCNDDQDLSHDIRWNTADWFDRVPPP